MGERPSPGGGTAFHRTGKTSPLGKLDDRIETFRIESIVKARLRVLAAQQGIPLSELMQSICRVVAYGPDELKRMHSDDVDVVASMLGFGATEP